MEVKDWLLIALLIIGTVNAAVYYVDQESIGGPCSDSGPGNLTQPWCTIHMANTNLTAGGLRWNR